MIVCVSEEGALGKSGASGSASDLCVEVCGLNLERDPPTEVSVVFLMPRQITNQYLTLGHGLFLQYLLQFIIHDSFCHSYLHRR